MASDILITRGRDLAAASQRSRSYALWIKMGLVAALMCILFGTVLIDMARDWWNEPAWSQGMLLPPLALYIFWINRNRTFSSRWCSESRGLLWIAIACCSFILGKLASEFFMMRFAFVILLIGLVWTFFGLPRLRNLAFPR